MLIIYELEKRKKNEYIDDCLLSIRKNFYIVLPPEYAENGTFPVYLYIDELMRYLKKDYYIGLYSTVALYAAKYQHMEYQIIVQQPIRDFVVGNTKIGFFLIWRKR